MTDTFRPGDIWRHNKGVGRLYVTDSTGSMTEAHWANRPTVHQSPHGAADPVYIRLMSKDKTTSMTAAPELTFRKELEIGVMITSGELIVDYVLAGRIDSSEIRYFLRRVVNEIGIGHTDEYLAEVTTHRVLHELSGRF